jgi:2-phospho-L-lactate/phosphoenolpyruvate guanylyltransferase
VIAVAVPVKDLLNAKQRLAGALGPAERATLARAMLRDVLTALAGARVDAVWVVTRDAQATELAHAFGATVLVETENRGHTSAVAFAQGHAVAGRVRCFLTVPGDVPCVTADEIGALADAARGERACVFTPSRSGLGTNGAALMPPDLMPLTFGEPSFENHLAAARARGLVPRVLALPGLGLDVDAPDDLTALLEAGCHTASGRLVAGWKLPAVARA